MSVLDRLAATAATTPDHPLFQFAGDRGEIEEAWTAAQTRDRAGAVAAHLRSLGVSPGDRVALVHPPGLPFVAALLGTLRVGAIPVPLAPPDPRDPHRHLPRFRALVENAGARVALTDASFQRARRFAEARDTVVGWVQRDRPRWPTLEWHVVDDLRAPRGPVPTHAASPDEVAVLQYTSGSTSTPRGVMITHGNLVHQLDCNAEELGIGPSSRAVFWVPHFHDFGLISGILSAVYTGASLTLMSPLTFLRRPDLWLERMSRSRATHTAAPNFAYDLVVRKTTPAQRAQWDLSALTVAMSAAEPVRDEVVRRFCEAFAPSGFRPEAFCPAYGLAEHTVGVSVRGRERLRVDRGALETERRLRPADPSSPRSLVLVGCGRPSRGVELRIVDPETRRALPEGAVGELWVDSPSKAVGYWGDPEASEATFRARLAADDGRTWLRTGDLGAVVGGEVFLTGRLKELLIVGGRNLYPEDLEASARDAHPDVRPGGVAAFAVERHDQGAERLAVLVERREAPTRAEAEAVATAVRRRLLADHQVACETVVVGGPGLVLKTSSGKVRRLACRDALLAGALGADAIAVVDASARERIAPEPEPEPAPEPAPELVAAAPAPADPVPADPVAADPAGDPVAADPRLAALAPSFAALVAQAARYLGDPKPPRGVVGRGWFEVDPDPALPAHRFFAPGRRLPALLRHDNRTSPDDAAPDARVAALRVLDPAAGGRLDAPLLDLPMLTGPCFFHRTAEHFFRFSVAPPAAREAMLRAEPHLGAAAWEGIRVGDSYRAFHYHTQTASRFVDADGRTWFARYRLRDPGVLRDGGFVDPAGQSFPGTRAPRRPDDPRPPTCLQDELVAALGAGGVGYVLEVQLAPAPGTPAADDALLDPTRPWPTDAHPWRRLASLTLDARVDPESAASLAFNPWHAPADLGVVLARHERQSASIAHVRTIAYEIAAKARGARPLSPGLAAFLERPAPKPTTVAVIGAGASGLTLASALERRGFTVTVLERSPTVAGMCETGHFDGLVGDLGGHMIFPEAYPTIVRLAREHGQALVPDFPDCLVDATGKVLPREVTPALRHAKQEAARWVQRSGALEPGLARVDRALAVPIREWLATEGLGALWAHMGPVFVAAGYGHLEDDVPAACLVRSFRHTADQERRFQLRDGFQALWERVAATLRDVRTGCEVRAVARDERGVEVTTAAGEVLRFDQLVVAHAPDGALAYLDATDEERELFGKVRHLPYASAYLEVEGLPASLRERWCFVAERTRDAASRGHALGFVHLGQGRDVVAVIGYAPPGGRAEAEARYAEDFARMGATVRRTLFWREWKYFPHFSPADLEAGCLDRLEALQGARRTWHASTLLSFELTECAAGYAEALAARIATPARAPVRTSVAPPPEDGPPASPVESFARFRAAIHVERARLEGYVGAVIADELEREAPGPEQDLADLGIDSLRAVRIHQRLTDELGVELDPAVLTEVTTVRALARTIVATAVSAPAAGGAA
jgi:acyl-CoA synthetase (AMP-forming)/AMP-acid ligase II/predicted NAD/FAD-dependent oxidoreductase/acyl carrier protein